MESLREEADKAKRECLEVKKIADEKEILFKQEQAALRKVGPFIAVHRTQNYFISIMTEVCAGPCLTHPHNFVILYISGSFWSGTRMPEIAQETAVWGRIMIVTAPSSPPPALLNKPLPSY